MTGSAKRLFTAAVPIDSFFFVFLVLFKIKINTFELLQTLILQTDYGKPKNHCQQSGERSLKSLLKDLILGY